MTLVWLIWVVVILLLDAATWVWCLRKFKAYKRNALKDYSRVSDENAALSDALEEEQAVVRMLTYGTGISTLDVANKTLADMTVERDALKNEIVALERGTIEIADSYEQQFLTFQENLRDYESVQIHNRTTIAAYENAFGPLLEDPDT